MSERTIEVQKRENVGKSANRRLRNTGFIPAVVYGGGKEPVSIQVPRKAFIDMSRHGVGENSIFLLQMADSDQKRHAMIRDMQVASVSRQVLHIDFQRVMMDQALRVEVPIELTGLAYGVKNENAVLDFVTRSVEVECLPADIPQHLTLDVTPLHVDQHLEASALELPKGVKLVTEADRVLVSVRHAKHEAEAAEAVAAVAEPQVAVKGKDAKAT